MSHTKGDWVFVATTYGDGSPCYAVKSAKWGYVVAYGVGQTDTEALANAQHIARAVSLSNKGGAV